MKKLLFLSLLMVATSAFAERTAEESCKADGFKPMACYRLYANVMFTSAAIGVDTALEKKQDKFPGVALVIKKEQSLYEYALQVVGDDRERAENIRKVHVHLQASFRAMIPKPGQTEQARKAGLEKRKARLAELLEKLPQDP